MSANAMYNDFAKRALDILPKGAFLTTQNGEKTNTMTIGWGSFGFEWGIPTVEVMVRESRFSKIALDKNLEFTLSFPTDSSLSSALSYCGQKSGKDTDKIVDCNLQLKASKNIATPVIDCKSLVFECKVIAKAQMDETLTDNTVLDKWYKTGDLHTFYFAKVLDFYEIK